MKIKSIRLENFRSFRDETISLNPYSCLVGPNGAGKSSVLAALNVFFREQTSSATDVSRLTQEDYHCKETADPVRITVTFGDLSESAQKELAAYVRRGELVVTAEAVFDPSIGFGLVKHFGQRLGMTEFRRFFEAEKEGARATELNEIYTALQRDFHDLPNARSKDDKAEALRIYESGRPERCVLIPSEDTFYGVNSTGKLAPFVQWVYVSAVKDASGEGQEAKNTALGKLIIRAVRSRVNIEEELKALKTETMVKYEEFLERHQASLTSLSQALQQRLEEWAHPDVRLGMEWLSDPTRSVILQSPIAGIKTGDGDFVGSLTRMGHGLQRSYLLALLQELAMSELPNAPTLILGCEEPELYQHPPQARHLAEVLRGLSEGNNQILVTTHSPYFVSGDGFEDVRLVRRTGSPARSAVSSLSYNRLCDRIREATGDDQRRRIDGLVAKIHQTLQPGIAEMFFARIPILVEGLEDVSYITTALHLNDIWPEFRRLGCHLIPANGKDRLIQPLAMAVELGMPVFTVFDADSDTPNAENKKKHEKDNRALMSLLGLDQDPFPDANVWRTNCAIWQTSLTKTVKADFNESDYDRVTNTARTHYALEKGIEKNDLFIAEWLTAAHKEGLRSPTLENLCESVLTYAKKRN